LAIRVESPARHRAAARQRTGMCLQNITSHPHDPFSRNKYRNRSFTSSHQSL
jgi:hypothetical protein